MVKLFTDEEMLEKCKDYQPIPLAIEQQVLHYGGDPDKINILNGVIKSPYKIGQPVNNVTEYAYQLPFQIPIDPEKFLNEYNKVVEKELKEKNLKIISELSRDMAGQAMVDAMSGVDEIEIPEAAKAAPIVGDIESDIEKEQDLTVAQRARARFRRDNPDYDREREAKMQDYLDRKQREDIHEARVGMKGEDKPKKTRRTQEQMIESKTMATEDINYAEL